MDLKHGQTSGPPSPLSCGPADWALDKTVAFLNHGSFGAVPRVVAQEQERWRRLIEAEPVEYLGRRFDRLLADAKAAIAPWLGMKPADCGMLTNATEGVNAVLRSLELKPGDELVTTNHVYNAVKMAMRFVARRAGADYREIELALPVQSSEQLAGRILAGISPRTRLLVIDHVTSPTALVFPVGEIAAQCARRGVDVLVDGAHAPGMLELDVPGIGAAYYAGNLHKWTCAPRGSAFLWVGSDRQTLIHPTIISHCLDQGFSREFGWQGTRDLTAWLATPRAISFMGEMGWENVRRHNHALATWAQAMLCRRWGVEPISPLDGSMLGSMATIRLPWARAWTTEAEQLAIQQRLYDEHRVEAPLVQWGGEYFIRVSCQVYNRPEEYERVGRAVEAMKMDRGSIG